MKEVMTEDHDTMLTNTTETTIWEYSFLLFNTKLTLLQHSSDKVFLLLSLKK